MVLLSGFFILLHYDKKGIRSICAGNKHQSQYPKPGHKIWWYVLAPYAVYLVFTPYRIQNFLLMATKVPGYSLHQDSDVGDMVTTAIEN